MKRADKNRVKEVSGLFHEMLDELDDTLHITQIKVEIMGRWVDEIKNLVLRSEPHTDDDITEIKGVKLVRQIAPLMKAHYGSALNRGIREAKMTKSGVFFNDLIGRKLGFWDKKNHVLTLYDSPQITPKEDNTIHSTW